MSTAWYKSRHIPRRVRAWTTTSTTTTTTSTTLSNNSTNSNSTDDGPAGTSRLGRRRSIELWDTTCIVTNLAARMAHDGSSASSSSSSGSGSGSSTRSSDGGDPTSSSSSTSSTSSTEYSTSSSSSSSSTFQILINPANPQLCGVADFPYFPRGGPVPSKTTTKDRPTKDSHPIMGYVSQWGGMEVGRGMFFAANVVDGLVHQLGGRELHDACRDALSSSSSSTRHANNEVREGHAIVTPAVGEFGTATYYRYLIHTVPPFYDNRGGGRHGQDPKGDDGNENDGPSEVILAQAYANALQIAQRDVVVPHLLTTAPTTKLQGTTTTIRMACPLLGAGCRGFPVPVAVRVAAQSAIKWMQEDTEGTVDNEQQQPPPYELVLAFGIPSVEIRKQLEDALDRAIMESLHDDLLVLEQ